MTRRQTEFCFQSWYNPLWMTGLKTPTNKITNNCIYYSEHKTNEWVLSKINFLVGPLEPLLATVKRRKLAWFRYVARHDSHSKTILQCTLESGQRRGLQRKCWVDNIEECTSLPMQKKKKNSSQGPPAEKKTGRGSLLNRPSCPPDDRMGQGPELNWTELNERERAERAKERGREISTRYALSCNLFFLMGK